MSIGRAFPVPDRPSRAATPPAKLGRACSWIHRCPRFALGVVDFSRLSEAASEKQRLEPPGAKWGGETRRARQLCASAALRVSSSPATVVRTVQQPERAARAPAPAAALGAWRPALPHPAAQRCADAPGRAAAHRRSRAQLPASRRDGRPGGGICTRRTNDVVRPTAYSAPLRSPFGARLRNARLSIDDQRHVSGIGLSCPSARGNVSRDRACDQLGSVTPSVQMAPGLLLPRAAESE